MTDAYFITVSGVGAGETLLKRVLSRATFPYFHTGNVYLQIRSIIKYVQKYSNRFIDK